MLTCKRSLVAVLLLAAGALAGCGGSPGGTGDAGGGAGSGGRGGTPGTGGAGARDAGADGSPTDLRADAATDTRGDGGDGAAPSDARSESATDLRADVAAGLDAPADGDAAADAPTDSATDSPAPAGDASAPDGGVTSESYLVALTGAEQVPPIDTAASGSATLSYDPASHILYWTLTHTLASPIAAHIHTAGGGDNGDPTFTLGFAASTTGSVTLDALQEADLRLGHLYLDVHSSRNPGGEIRGQILRPGETLWIARLNGAEEVPPNPSAATAAMSLIVNSAHSSAHYRLVTSLAATSGHIHTGIAGVSVTPIITLMFVGSTSEGDLPIDADVFAALDQTQLYANVHTLAYPNGEIRGQLLRAGSTLYVAKLTGASEVPPVSSALTGNASVAVDYRGTTVRYAETVSLLATMAQRPTMAQIHPGIAGVAGGPILVFSNLSASSNVATGTGTLTQPQLAALAAGRLYTDLQTAAFPSGEIRGQFLRPGERLFAAALSGGNEVPPVASAATGSTQLILNPAATSLRYESAVTGLGDATSAFLVNGPAGVAGGASVATLTVVGINPIGTLAVTANDVSNLNASAYYIDVHSSLHPEGEIRGQVSPR